MTAHAQSAPLLHNESHRSQLLDYERPDGSIQFSQAARSEENISTWNTYLPEQCVKTMVAMGWDRST